MEVAPTQINIRIAWVIFEIIIVWPHELSCEIDWTVYYGGDEECIVILEVS